MYSTSSVTWPLTTLRYGVSMKPNGLTRPKVARGADQTDVRAFRRLDRAHTAEVGRVHVRAPPWRRGRGTDRQGPVRKDDACSSHRQRVVLIHELGELGSAEELLDGGVHRTDVDQGLRVMASAS